MSPRRFNRRIYMIVASGRSVLTFNAATSASSASTTIRSALPLTLSPPHKLSHTYATLLEALNRHRGKGQQKVTVEHVHVHAGGQAVVGTVETPGRGSPEIRGSSSCNADCPCISAGGVERGQGAGAHANHRRCRTGGAVCTAAYPRALRGAIGMLRGGRYTAEAITRRRELASLLRAMRSLAREPE